jgi:outer membrane receptor protein involved in Fe transport/dipeptidyl aminopeptidase/acylaminoacyl peptidase
MGSFRQAVRSATVFTALALVIAAAPACASETGEDAYHLPAQPLAASLRAVSTASGVSVVAPADLIAGRTAPVLDGDYTPEAALAALLKGSGLRAKRVGDGFVVEQEPAPVSAVAESQGSGNPIVVTGSRIRGAPVASPVIRLDQEHLRNAGQTSMLDVVRHLPQAFGGGANFGIGLNVGSGNGIDMGGAVTINLRGLGSDATLTLLNGHRLAYNGARQAIDVSAIPLAAVDRIEIVPDGASALYGSDAVAGVANIILKPDYDGVTVEAEGGLATRGGYGRQRYGATAGARWSGGGFMASYEYASSSAIFSDERAFTRLHPGLIIYPPLERHAVVATGHQDLTDTLTFKVDALFNRRRTKLEFPDNDAGDLSVSHTEQPTTSRSLAIAPSLELALPGDWRANLSGVYGNERLHTEARNFTGDTIYRRTPLTYHNSGESLELAADGPLFALPGGTARLALGAGYRRNVLDGDYGPPTIPDIRGKQDSYFGYGELNLPLVSPATALRGISRLNFSAALRYERYPGVAGVATPKLGLIYAPVAGLDFKGSWGRSFRAPTLAQQHQMAAGSLYPVARLGGTGYPAGSTALLLSGGNPEVRPERARTWTAGVDLHPRWLEGARLQVSYFRTRYAERIVTPIALTAQSLSNPAYAGLVTFVHDPAQAAAAIAAAPQFTNSSGAPVDPAKVVAIVDNRNRNAERQAFHGLDVLADYRFALGGGEATASVDAAYLQIRQQLAPGQPVQPRSGLLFTPPDWRARQPDLVGRPPHAQRFDRLHRRSRRHASQSDRSRSRDDHRGLHRALSPRPCERTRAWARFHALAAQRLRRAAGPDRHPLLLRRGLRFDQLLARRPRDSLRDLELMVTRPARASLGTAAAMLGVFAALQPSAARAACEDLLPATAEVSGASRPVTVDDLVRLRDIGEPDASTYSDPTPLSVSPDGLEVAFMISRAEPDRNAYCQGLVVMPVDGSAPPRVLADAGELIINQEPLRGSIVPIGYVDAPRPRWSPDGRWLAFLRRDNGTTRLWRVAARGGAALAVSPPDADVESFAFASGGARLAFTTQPAVQAVQAEIDREGMDGWLYDERIMPNMGARPQIPAGLPLETSAADTATGTALPLDGSEAAALEAAGRSDAATTAVAGDGRRAWVEPREKRPKSPVRLLAETGPGKPVACEAAACSSGLFGVWWDPRGREVRFMRREGWDKEMTALYRWTPGRGAPKAVSKTTDVLLGCLPARAQLVCLRETSREPRHLVTVDPMTGAVRRVFDPNPEFARIELGKVERLRWRNDRGLEAWGDLVLPPDYRPGTRLPLVVVQYHSDGFLRGGTGNEYPIFAFAAHGFAVLSLERPAFFAESVPGIATWDAFNAANNKDWAERRSLLSSLLTGVAMVVDRGIADPRRIGITGLSDGASTAYFALINSNVFAAASISSCCVDAQTSMVYAGLAYADQARAWGYPPLTRPDPDFWRPNSLVLNAARLDRPLLMQISDSEMLYALESFSALREQGQPVEMHVFPGEFHFKWQPAHRRAIYRRNLDWFAFWLQGREDPAPAKAAQYRRWETLRSRRKLVP